MSMTPDIIKGHAHDRDLGCYLGQCWRSWAMQPQRQCQSEWLALPPEVTFEPGLLPRIMFGSMVLSQLSWVHGPTTVGFCVDIHGH